MYKAIATISLSLLLQACGGAPAVEDAQTLSTVSVQAEQQQERFYTAWYLDKQQRLVGYGKDAVDGAYDVLAGMATGEWKPGTDAYRAMLTEQGMLVWLKDEQTGKMYKASVRETKQGLEIVVQEG